MITGSEFTASVLAGSLWVAHVIEASGGYNIPCKPGVKLYSTCNKMSLLLAGLDAYRGVVDIRTECADLIQYKD